MTRWDELFDDLAAQATALAEAELEGEVAERTRIETGRLELQDRLSELGGCDLRIVTSGPLTVQGRLAQLGGGWMLIEEAAGREALVALPAVLSVAGAIPRFSGLAGTQSVSRRLGLRSALRGIVRDRSGVRLHLVDGSVLDGTIDSVGADFLEVALHSSGEPRRRSEVRQTSLVSIAGLAVLRRDA